MAKKNATTEAGGMPGNIEPQARYSVRLLRPVERHGRILSPMDEHVMTGKVLSSLPPEAIHHAEQV